MRHISITGSNSFIGYHLIKKLSICEDVQLTCLSRRKSIKAENANTSIHYGDLLNSASLQNFAKSGSSVIHMAYLHDASKEDNLTAMQNLLDHCEHVGIKRFIHCSTAVVAGRINDNAVTETTVCNPVTKYERTKLLLEDLLLRRSSNKFEAVILRPTAVFGAGGKNLLKLADTVRYGSKLANYLKSCVYNRRKMNLVYVANVVSAIEFLIRASNMVDKQVFIVSDDENAYNNYRDVEKYLIDKLGCKDYSFPRVVLHPIILKLLLFAAGRSHINPDQIYDCRKLIRYGFKKPIDFVHGLDEFIEWYKEQQRHDRSGNR